VIIEGREEKEFS